MGHRSPIWAQKDRFEPEVSGREVVPISVTRTLELDSIFKMHSELYNVKGKYIADMGLFIHLEVGWVVLYNIIHAVVGYLGQLQLDNNTS